MRTLAQVFNDEAAATGRGLRTLAADSGPYAKDATADPRLKILNECGRLGKVLRKSDGTQYSVNELFSMDLDDLQALFDRTPADASRASQASDANIATVPRGVGDGSKPIINMAAIFNGELQLRLLSARLDPLSISGEDREKYLLIKALVEGGRMPLKPHSLNYFSCDELMAWPLTRLKIIAVNTQKTVRML